MQDNGQGNNNGNYRPHEGQSNYYYGGYNGGYPAQNSASVPVGPEVVTLNERQVKVDGELYEKPMTIGNWLGVILLMAIPIVNVVMFIVYLCGGKRKSRQRFFLAGLIFAGIITVLSIVMVLFMGDALTQLLQQIAGSM